MRQSMTHPITMLYLDGDHLTLVNYCDAGNWLMVKVTAADEKGELDFADLSGRRYGYARGHLVFTITDANHHIED